MPEPLTVSPARKIQHPNSQLATVDGRPDTGPASHRDWFDRRPVALIGEPRRRRVLNDSGSGFRAFPDWILGAETA